MSGEFLELDTLISTLQWNPSIWLSRRITFLIQRGSLGFAGSTRNRMLALMHEPSIHETHLTDSPYQEAWPAGGEQGVAHVSV